MFFLEVCAKVTISWVNVTIKMIKHIIKEKNLYLSQEKQASNIVKSKKYKIIIR